MSRTAYLTYYSPTVTKLPPVRLYFHKRKRLVPYTPEPLLLRLETIGRVCYQSEDKITEDSHLSFVRKLVERRHWSVLEHIHLLLCLPADELRMLLDYQLRHQLSAITCRHYDWLQEGAQAGTISCSYRHLLELLELTLTGFSKTNGFSAEPSNYLACRLYQLLTDTLQLPIPTELRQLAETYGLRQSLISPPASPTTLKYWHMLDIADPYQRWKLLQPDPDYVTFKIVCDRGVSHELVRHRFEFSFTQESTRYVDYSKTNVKVIGDPARQSGIITEALAHAAKAYRTLREEGVPPQTARGVLPTATATTIYVTASRRSWQSFLMQRCSPAAHPQMRLLAAQIRDQLG